LYALILENGVHIYNGWVVEQLHGLHLSSQLLPSPLGTATPAFEYAFASPALARFSLLNLVDGSECAPPQLLLPNKPRIEVVLVSLAVAKDTRSKVCQIERSEISPLAEPAH
jgi:hypothetical protein